jgi:acetyl esterase/lipase
LRVFICMASAVWGALVCEAATPASLSAQPQNPVVSTPEFTLVPPPAEERRAVVLTGRAPSLVPEVWEQRMQRGSSDKHPGDWPQLWVRNVSVPTLTPFLPEKSKATGAAMVIAPGGAYLELSIEWEGYKVARWLNQRGIAAFVLKYRLLPTSSDPQLATEEIAQMEAKVAAGMGHGPLNLSALITERQRTAMLSAIEDGRDAVRYVRDHAAKWNLSRDRIGIMGFSSGGGVAVGVALKWDAASRPDLLASIYGALPEEAVVKPTSPPAFIAVAANDPSAPYSLALLEAWRTAKIPVELHVFQSGGHGFGMHVQGAGSDAWAGLYDHWLAAHSFETPPVAGNNK